MQVQADQCHCVSCLDSITLHFISEIVNLWTVLVSGQAGFSQRWSDVQVVFNGKFSRLQDVLSSVSQGSVLGLILF